MFKDAAMFLIGFVGGLVVTVIFIIAQMPAPGPKAN
jgi:xanthosine utilization system XapX-like protein